MKSYFNPSVDVGKCRKTSNEPWDDEVLIEIAFFFHGEYAHSA